MYLASAELAAVSAILGRIPSNDEYLGYVSELTQDTYRYLSFDKMAEYIQQGNE